MKSNELPVLHPLTYAVIDLEALRSNYRLIKKAAGDTGVFCVVKADAYGHGAVRVAETLYGEGARWFGVATPGEGAILRREADIPEASILNLGAADPRDAEALIECGITQNLYSYEFGLALAEHIPAGKKLRVHVKLDTGMNRLGFPAKPGQTEKTVAQILELSRLGCFEMEGIFSHFIISDEANDDMSQLQYARYKGVVDRLAEAGLTFPVCHISNSAGLLRYPGCRLNLVRAGIILYGIMPSDDLKYDGYRTVMSLYSTVSHVHTAERGETVGYGTACRLESRTGIATIAIGYADGFTRGYKGAGIGIGGRDLNLLGRVCMDQCMADVTGTSVCPGDRVTLFGWDPDAKKYRPVELLSDRAHTNAYESCCMVSKRVPRIYLDGKL